VKKKFKEFWFNIKVLSRTYLYILLKHNNPVMQMAASSTLNYKLIIVGDGYVGKTSLLVTYTTNNFPAIYSPTIFENYNKRVRIDTKPVSNHKSKKKQSTRDVNLMLFDTAGQEGWETLRKSSYSNVDVVIVCFSIMSPHSFNNVTDTWWPEIKAQVPNAKIVLVGTKKDLQTDSRELMILARNGLMPVSRKKAEELKKKIGACAYIGKSLT